MEIHAYLPFDFIEISAPWIALGWSDDAESLYSDYSAFPGPHLADGHFGASAIGSS